MKHLLAVEKPKQAEGWLKGPVRGHQDEADLMWKTEQEFADREVPLGEKQWDWEAEEQDGTSQRGENFRALEDKATEVDGWRWGWRAEDEIE